MICPPPLRSVSLDSQAKLKLDGVRVPFVANGGQTDLAVAFYAQTLGGATFVTHKGEIVHALLARRRGGKPSGWSLTESMVGGRATPRGQEPADTRVSYFVGCERERWGSDLTAYRTVGLGEVWPGVSVSLRASGGSVEKLFTVKPGASDSTIRVRLGGAQSLSVDETGALAAGTGVGKFTFSAPIAYQEKGRGRIPVPVSYRTFGRDYGFRLGRHDPNLPVVIDPLLQSTYLAYETRAYAIGIHPVSGEVYVAGVTRSINFPGVAGGAQPTHSSGASAEAFVARLNPGLTAFLQSTYLGGIGDDWIFALAIHPIT
jgi:hypothetical protein